MASKAIFDGLLKELAVRGSQVFGRSVRIGAPNIQLELLSGQSEPSFPLG